MLLQCSKLFMELWVFSECSKTQELQIVFQSLPKMLWIFRSRTVACQKTIKKQLANWVSSDSVRVSNIWRVNTHLFAQVCYKC